MKLYAVVYRSKKFERVQGSVYEKISSAKAHAQLVTDMGDVVGEPVIITIPLKVEL